jgi:hypothetical protein
MINLTDNAKEHLDSYLQQVRTCLKVCSSIDADEVEQNIKEHIESELQDSSEPISYDVLDAVLKKLGSPQQWVPEEEIAWWRKIILRLRSGPEDWRLAYITFGLFVLWLLLLHSSGPRRVGFLFIGPFAILHGNAAGLLLLVSFIIARATMATVGDSKKLGGQKWLIYPSLVVFYIPIFFFLLLWPVALLAIIAHEYDHAKIDMFPWNTGNDTPYWTLVLIFFALTAFLWWLILALVHKKTPRFLGVVFRPFAKTIEPKKINRFMVIITGLAAICILTILLMIKYQGWSEYFIKIFG